MNTILRFALFLAAVGCTDQREKTLSLRLYLQEEFAIQELPRAIFVISDEGCPVCNRAFLDAIRPHTSTRETLFLVRAVGLSMNMGDFMKETRNLRFDDGEFLRLGLLEGSGMILTRNGEVDEILPINAQGLEGQLLRIQFVLDSLAMSRT